MRKPQNQTGGQGSVTPGSLSRSLNLIGNPWSLHILRVAFLGTLRFQDFQSTLGIPRQTLMQRLNQLTDNAVFYKKPAKHTRVVYEYHLTPKGLDLYSFILMIWRWHRKWHLDEALLPAKLYHRNCGASMLPALRCSSCHEPLYPDTVEVENVSDSTIELQDSTRKTRILNEWEKLGEHYLASVVVGDGWSILVLNAILRGIENYDALQTALSISSNVLSSRLKTLLSLQLLEQRQQTSDRRMYRYTPTEKARDLFPIVISLIQWGDRWLAGSEGPPDLLRHSGCGQLLTAEPCCNVCGERLHAVDVRTSPVGGIQPDT